MGAMEFPLLRLPFVAGEDLSNFRFYVGAMSGTTIVHASTAGEGGVGIIQNGCVSGDNVAVETRGVSMAKYGGTIAAGDALTNDANGCVVTSTLSTDVIIGTALVAGVSGDIGAVLVGPASNSADAAYQTITIPIQLAAITAAGTIAAITPGFAGRITKVQFAVTTPTSTASKLATLSLAIGGTALTGGAVALTTALTNALGDNVAGTAITAGNSFTAAQQITVAAASVTAFQEGAGFLLLTVAR